MVSPRPRGKFIHTSQSGVPSGQTQTTFGFLPTQLVTPIIQAVGSLQDRWVKASDELSKVFQQYSGQAREEKEQELKQEIATLANQINTKQEQIIDQETQKTIKDISNQRLIVPSYFDNNVNWVMSGQITKIEFLSGLQNLLDSGTAYYKSVDTSVESAVDGVSVVVEPEYPLSTNIKISFTSNIGMFSTSIPISDVGQLQVLSNQSNEWKYTLIGDSTNQPLMTLSGLITKINSMIASAVITPQSQPPQLPPIEEPHITTVHIPPPEIPVEEPQMVTVTPTEPGQVNWIPEPFFSFINNVFRR